MGQLHIGIVGAGVGGLAAAVALRSHGHRVSTYEQAGKFGRVGADINLTPNAVRALDGLEDGAEAVALQFEDGGADQVDVAIGADGIHSRVRARLLGDEYPRFTGVVSFRCVVPTERVRDVPEIDAFTKWWGPNPQSQIVTFPLNQGRETFVFATTGQDSWTEESWTSAGDVQELRGFYRDFHADARKLLDACDSTLKSALYEREPIAQWSSGCVTLLGDACHPMLPFMAQGACMAIEDAVVLGRALGPVAARAQAPQALLGYCATRQDRTARIQVGSRGNQWMKTQGNADWVYGYDAWNVPLATA